MQSGSTHYVLLEKYSCRDGISIDISRKTTQDPNHTPVESPLTIRQMVSFDEFDKILLSFLNYSLIYPKNILSSGPNNNLEYSATLGTDFSIVLDSVVERNPPQYQKLKTKINFQTKWQKKKHLTIKTEEVYEVSTGTSQGQVSNCLRKKQG